MASHAIASSNSGALVIELTALRARLLVAA